MSPAPERRRRKREVGGGWDGMRLAEVLGVVSILTNRLLTNNIEQSSCVPLLANVALSYTWYSS